MLFACKCLNVILSAVPESIITNRNAYNNHDDDDNNDAATVVAAAAATAKRLSLGGENGSSVKQPSNHYLHQRQQQQQQLQKIKADQLQEFFEKASGPFMNVIRKIQQNDLIQEIQFDHQWTFYLCLCCDTLNYAQRKESKDTFLINSNLLTNEEDVNYLKTNENFSKIFGIILNPLECSVDATTTTEAIHTGDGFGVGDMANLEMKAKTLGQHYRDAIQMEIEATDERMRQYSERQFAQLKVFREKAEEEYKMLLSLLKNVPESMTIITNELNTTTTATDSLNQSKVVLTMETPPATPESTPMSIGNSPVLKQPPELVHPKYSPFNKPKNFAVRNTAIVQPVHKVESSADAEFFFDMDGIQDRQPTVGFCMSDVDESDSDESTENGEGVAIGRQALRPKSLSIASSLPVSVPSVLGERISIEDDLDEYANAEDIAASIKALAKSVHGDAVFGELPPPRFSTRI